MQAVNENKDGFGIKVDLLRRRTKQSIIWEFNVKDERPGFYYTMGKFIINFNNIRIKLK